MVQCHLGQIVNSALICRAPTPQGSNPCPPAGIYKIFVRNLKSRNGLSGFGIRANAASPSWSSARGTKPGSASTAAMERLAGCTLATQPPLVSRTLAARAMLEAAEGKDPVAERKAQRTQGAFEELAARYVETYAKRRNKSWRQADRLVRTNLLPRWGKLKAAEITRFDVKAMMARIESAPVLANQTLAAASAIFAWAIREDILKVNLCAKVERNEVRSRERVLSDGELPRFWAAFDDAGLVKGSALKMILLTGQRPGEVAHMRSEHIVDGWWELPGAPNPPIGLAGNKERRIAPGLATRACSWRCSPNWTSRALDYVWRRPVGGLRRGNAQGLLPVGTERATPHDLRRTHGSAITRLGLRAGCDEQDLKSSRGRHRNECTIGMGMLRRTSGSWRLWRRTS